MTRSMTRREKAVIHRASVSRNKRVSRNETIKVTDLMKNTRARKGKCPQKIGMWGNISTDYRTPSNSTHDARYSQTVSNREV